MNQLNPVHDKILGDFNKVHAGIQSGHKNPDPNWIQELGLNVSYDYSPAEAPNNDVESMTCGPGCDSEVSINSIEFRGIDITAKFAPEEIKKMEQEILDELEGV